jgi:GxGYxYP putative glycoside hydrolase C-terminal domain/GxGYxY sequence motif in domain of unknown function N-terminal
VSKETPGLGWHDNRLIPTFQSPQHLDVYDLRGAARDTQLTATIIAGLVNRPEPKVYLMLGDDDAYWLDQVFQSIPQHVVPANGNTALDALLSTYHSSVQGLIIYDPALIDTINVATTLAGQRSGLVVSPSQAQSIQKTYPLPILFDLRTYGWRTRLQAYNWARQQLLGDASSHLLAGIDPGALAGLRSFLVATRTFAYWLDSRKYTPDLSTGWFSERNLMQQLIGAFPAGAAHLGWFIDEGSGVNLTSMAAMPVLASDYFNNLEVWTAIQSPEVSSHASLPALPDIGNKIYLSFTVSDGDNLQYMQHRMLRLWRDRTRGSLPIGWTFSPLLWQIAPAMVAYYLRTATAHDELIAGPSGAGYMFPSRWPSVRLASFLQQTGQLMQALNMTTLEVLDTDFWQRSCLPLASKISLSGMTFTNEARQRDFVHALKPYGLRGILSGSGNILPRNKQVDGIPLYHNLGIASSASIAVKMVKAAALLNPRRPLFLNLYVLAWSMTPTALLQVVQQLGSEYEIVLPGTLLAMLARVS